MSCELRGVSGSEKRLQAPESFRFRKAAGGRGRTSQEAARHGIGRSNAERRARWMTKQMQMKMQMRMPKCKRAKAESDENLVQRNAHDKEKLRTKSGGSGVGGSGTTKLVRKGAR